MPPNDPRLVGLTDLDIAVERETVLWFDDKALRYCENCDIFTYEEVCPLCFDKDLEAAPTGDPVIDEVLARKKSGEKVSLSEYFKRDADGNYSGAAFDLED